MNFLDVCKASHEVMLPEWIKAHQQVVVPEWDEYFMTMALVASTRSQDAQKQMGAVLAKNNKIIGTGYNSWNSGMDDGIIPNTRPLKYDAVLHAEHNAVINRTVEDPSGAVCYVNAYPCLECLKELVQYKILDFVIMPGGAAMLNHYTDNQKALYYEIVSRHQVSFREFKLREFTLDKVRENLLLSNGV